LEDIIKSWSSEWSWGWHDPPKYWHLTTSLHSIMNISLLWKSQVLQVNIK